MDARDAIDIINKMFWITLEVLLGFGVGLLVGLTVALFQSVLKSR